MTLHEAFFLEVASPDLVFALSAMLERPPLLPARRALWQWLFMLTPVVSSTFASIRAQFAGLEAEDLGWLIIDEAGQAPPQAAVGAIMRAKRVVVVGDPLQIEPVVTQSTRLLDTLGRHWLGDSRSRYAIDSHSVQTFADRGYGQGVRHPLDAENSSVFRWSCTAAVTTRCSRFPTASPTPSACAMPRIPASLPIRYWVPVPGGVCRGSRRTVRSTSKPKGNDCCASWQSFTRRL